MAKKKSTPVIDEIETEVEGEEAKPEKPIIPVNRDKTFGIEVHGGLYVTLWQRKLYTERTVTNHPRWGEKVHEAGEYGAWQLSDHPYPPSVSRALHIVSEKMLQSALMEHAEEAEDIQNIVEYIDAVQQDIFEHFKGVK